jgi:hypothetical protein
MSPFDLKMNKDYGNYIISEFNNFEDVIKFYKENIMEPIYSRFFPPTSEERKIINDLWNQYKDLV